VDKISLILKKSSLLTKNVRHCVLLLCIPEQTRNFLHQFRLFFISSLGPGPGELLPSLGVRRLLSVVCKLFTFQASSPKPLGRLKPNLAGMFLGWSSTKLLFFVPVGYSIWLPRPIICSDWLKFQRYSSLKLMN
jgi:hypothetical protein